MNDLKRTFPRIMLGPYIYIYIYIYIYTPYLADIFVLGKLYDVSKSHSQILLK